MGSCCEKPVEGGGEVASNSTPGTAPVINEDEELRQVFNEFDMDKSGSIELHELKLIMMKMGQNPSDDDVKAMFGSADVNGDGKIDFEEFKVISKAAPLVESLRAVFKELDIDGDGELTKQEICGAFTNMGHPITEEQIATVFDQVDVNKDGKINCDEFVEIMTKNIKKPI